MSGVSFITTVFNKAAQIERTAQSLFTQTGDFSREFIFIDDGSTDQSLKILRRLESETAHVKVISKQNGGPASAFNLGAEMAQYPLLKPMDGDDVLTNDAVLRLMPGLENGSSIVFGRKIVLTEMDCPEKISRSGPPQFRKDDQPLKSAIETSLSGCSEVLLSRDAFLAVGGCDVGLFIQDQSYIRRLAAKGHAFSHSQDVVAFSPPSPSDALCFNSPQIDHDNNAAWVRLIEQTPNLDIKYRRRILKKCASRAWKFARRVQGKPIGCDSAFWVYMASYISLLPVFDAELKATLTPFLRTGRVRVPVPTSS